MEDTTTNPENDIFVIEDGTTSQSRTTSSARQQQTKKRRLQEEEQQQHQQEEEDEEQGGDKCDHILIETNGQGRKKQRLETTETAETLGAGRISTCNVDSSSQQKKQQQHQRRRQQKHVHWRRKMMTENNIIISNDKKKKKEVTDTHIGLLYQSLRKNSYKCEENGNVVVGKKSFLVKTTENNNNNNNKNNEGDLHVHDDDDDDDGVYKTWYTLDDPAIVFDDYNDHDIWFTVRSMVFLFLFFSDDASAALRISVVCVGICLIWFGWIGCLCFARAIDSCGLYICSHFKTQFSFQSHIMMIFTKMNPLLSNIHCQLFCRREE